MKYLKFAGLAFVVLMAIGYFVPDQSHKDLPGDSVACGQGQKKLDAAHDIGGDAAVKAAIGYAQIDVDSNPIKDCLRGG